ncbi:MAG: hypothetical protein U0R18_04335 [Mycobacterium sp.]
MADDEDLESRVTALEGQVRDLSVRTNANSHDAAAARILAGAADRAVSETRAEIREFRADVRQEFEAVRTEVSQEFADMRTEVSQEFADMRSEFGEFRAATTATFNAQRQDFIDLRQDFIDLRNHVNDGFARMDNGFSEIRGRLDGTAAGLQRIADTLQAMNQG